MALIDQQEALNAIEKCHKRCCRTDSNGDEWIHYETTLNEIESIKPTQEIIHCKDCKHWNPQFKTANGNGLGSCDFHNVALVTSEGFCYWADRRGEAE